MIAWLRTLRYHEIADRMEVLAAELAAERTVRKQLADMRDPMVATVSFLTSVIRCGEPFTTEVRAAVGNFYTRWDVALEASDALDKETTR